MAIEATAGPSKITTLTPEATAASSAAPTSTPLRSVMRLVMGPALARVDGKRRPLRKLDELFAEIAPFQHADERLRRAFQALGDGLAIADTAGRDVAGEFGQRRRPKRQVVGDDKAFDFDPFDEEL